MKTIKAESAFLIIGIVFGLAFLFVSAPFQAPDEYVHFYRAYSVSEGQLLPSQVSSIPRYIVDFSQNVSPDPLPGYYLNKQSKKALLAQLQKPFSDSERAPFSYDTTRTYTPVAYLPQAAGILIGRLLRLPALLIFYLGRLANLAAWIGLTYLAIRTTPVFKWLFAFVALMPMTLFLAASNSPDCPLIALSILFAARIFHLAFGADSAASKWDILLPGILIFLIAAIKPAYILLVFLFLMVPAKRFGGWLRYAGAGILLLLFAIMPLVAWQALSGFHPNTISSANTAAQIHFIQANPQGFLVLFWKTMLEQASLLWKGFVGILGWLDTPLPNYLYILYLAVLILVAWFSADSPVELPVTRRIVAFTLFLVAFVGIFIFFFITWTRAGAATIEGVQGRYFIPFASFLFLPFSNHRLRQPAGFSLGVTLFILFALAVSVRVLLARYFAI